MHVFLWRDNALDPVEAVGILFNGMINGVSPPRSSLLPVASLLLMLTTLSVCNLTGRLNSAAAGQGKISAGAVLPDLSDDCRNQEPHACVEVGNELRSVLVKGRGALNPANAWERRYIAFYDDTKRNLERSP